MPLAPATPTTVVPTSITSGTSERQPWCIVIQSPRLDRSDAWAHAWSADSGKERDISSLAIRGC